MHGSVSYSFSLVCFQKTKSGYIYSDQIVSSRKFSKHVFVQNANRDIFWSVCVFSLLKVSKFQKQIFLFSFPPKNQQNYFLISALASEMGRIKKIESLDLFFSLFLFVSYILALQGRYRKIFSFVFWRKWEQKISF